MRSCRSTGCCWREGSGGLRLGRSVAAFGLGWEGKVGHAPWEEGGAGARGGVSVSKGMGGEGRGRV